MTPDLAVVVVHHQGRSHLRAGLEALFAADRGGRAVEIILVDNGSDGVAVEEIRRVHGPVRVVTSRTNRGFAGGCHLGVAATEAPHVAFVNDDAVVATDWLVRLAEALEGAPEDVVSVGGCLTDLSGTRSDFYDGFMTFDGHAFQADFGRPLDTLDRGRPGDERLFACGGNMIVRRDIFLSSGGFDEDYFAYLEDVDFGWRQWIQGRRVLFEPRAVARHRGGATGEALGIYRRGYLIEKNAFMTAYKNLQDDSWRALAPAILAAFANRVARMLGDRNPAARLLRQDPYQDLRAGRRNRVLEALRTVIGRVSGRQRAVVDDPLTIAHLRAMLWIFDHAERLAAKRRDVQSRRKRSDREIFERFPLRRVPTYPGDDMFDREFFSTLWPENPALVRTTLGAIFADRR